MFPNIIKRRQNRHARSQAAAFVFHTLLTLTAPLTFADPTPTLIEPREKIIRPFNGKNLNGFTTWHEETGLEDTHKNYAAHNGMIRIRGLGNGYLATVNAYKNYHLSIEYKWGKRSPDAQFVRNSGVLLHAIGPHGAAKGRFMASVECQLAQGCEGDFIAIQGIAPSGAAIPVTLTSETTIASDGRTRWLAGGQKTTYAGKQFWWSNHQPGFKELIDTRGQNDLASPLGQWTQVECICIGDRITLKINGHTVNEAFNVSPSAGRILLENEKHEIFFRNFEIRPLTPQQRATLSN